MALTALIMAYDTVDGGSEALRATLPVAGRSVVEYQARQAVVAGARHVIVLVERMPADLIAALDRLRRDGLAVDLARSMADAADRAHPDEGLLLFGDGCLLPQRAIDRLMAAGAPAIATLDDRGEHGRFERIDGVCRWAGLALIDGASARKTAAMLGDWDAQSTLLRRAVQRGAQRVAVDPADLPVMATSAAAVTGFDRTLLAGSRGDAPGWPARLFALVDGPAAQALAARGIDPVLPAWGAAALAGLGPLLTALGWPGAGLAALMLSGPVAVIAARLGRLRLTPVRHARLTERIRIIAAALALPALAQWLAIDGQWGWWVLAAGTAAAMAALWQARRLGPKPLPRWLADADAITWGLAPFALPGMWGEGLIAATVYAVASAGYALAKLEPARDRAV